MSHAADLAPPLRPTAPSAAASPRGVFGVALRAVAWLAAPAAQPGDSAADTLRQRFLVMTGLLMSGGGLLWGALSLGLGAPLASVIPFAYVALTALNLLWLRIHRSFHRTRVVQLTASLVLPFCFQCALGGFEASGAMMLWGMLALVGALTFMEKRGSAIWLVLYLVLLVVSGWMETTGALRPISQDEQVQAFALVLNISVISSIIFVLTSYFVRSRETMAQVLAAKSLQYEDLLYRTLPPAIVDRLRHGETAIADATETAAVLFVDIVGFTGWAQRASPMAVVTALGEYFRALDELTLAHGMEKIKTIGDAYMAVCGVPQPSADPTDSAAALALAIVEATRQFASPDGQPLQVRVGIDVGALAAGVISEHKLVYDVWGGHGQLRRPLGVYRGAGDDPRLGSGAPSSRRALCLRPGRPDGAQGHRHDHHVAVARSSGGVRGQFRDRRLCGVAVPRATGQRRWQAIAIGLRVAANSRGPRRVFGWVPLGRMPGRQSHGGPVAVLCFRPLTC